jgi:hypothetical protein
MSFHITSGKETLNVLKPLFSFVNTDLIYPFQFVRILFVKNPAIRLRRCVYNDDGDETGAAKERNAAHSAGGK